MAKSITVEALKPYVRKVAPHFLEQPNVTSVGIGYKQVAEKTSFRQRGFHETTEKASKYD